MLTGKQVRVRQVRGRIVPCYVGTTDPAWLEVAARLCAMFQGQEGRSRGNLEEDLRETFGKDPGQLIHQGLARLLQDRCDFEVVAEHAPEQLREAVFLAAAALRKAEIDQGIDASSNDQVPLRADQPAFRVEPFDRERVLRAVAERFDLTAERVDQGLFADLKAEQRLVRFRDISPEHLLQRYNVALAQAVLLRATKVHVNIRGEAPARYRRLFRVIKFHRLVCEVEGAGPDAYLLRLDGPLSLFTATQRYGLQMALFLPAVLLCRDFDLRAEVQWGPRRRPRTFTLSASDGLMSHALDVGTYVPAELAMFVDLFRRKITDWEIQEETGVFPLGDRFWVPDYRLVHRESGRTILLEVLGFWRRASAERHLESLRRHAAQPFLLAVSDQLHVDEADLGALPAGIHRFRQMPLPEEVARLAAEVLAIDADNR